MTDTATTTRTVRRLSIPLALPYAAAVRRFEELVPAIDLQRFTALSDWDDVVKLADREAPLGLMRFWKLDIPPLMVGGRAAWDCVEYLMGNQVIAERMYRHDPVALLYAPLRILIHADGSGDAVFVIDQPSSQFDSFGRPEISVVGRELDEKVGALLAALGTEPPAGLAA